MKYEQKLEFVTRCRERMSKKRCQACKKTFSLLLQLKGRPQLRTMVRTGATMVELKAAMRERGWYCRKCVVRTARITGVIDESLPLRPQFETMEEYLAWLKEHRGPGSEYFARQMGGEVWLDYQAKEKTAATTAGSQGGSPPALAPSPGPGVGS